jgi:hypothetical protein
LCSQQRRTSAAFHNDPREERSATADAMPATRLNPRNSAACLRLVTSPLAPTNARFATRRTSDRIVGSVEMVSTILSTPTRSFAARLRMAVAAAGSGSISSPVAGAVLGVLGVLIVLSHKSAAQRFA